ncbi:MAG: aminoglycoside N(3)-acetyltransferase [Clostridium sp.]
MDCNLNSDVILTKEDLVRLFSKCGVESGQTIFVHSSLKSLGFVVGGAETVIRALLEIVSENGTIMMPSQTWKNLDPKRGVHWEIEEKNWDIIREHWPAYNKDVTPSIGMGVIAEVFRKWPGAMRTDHPVRSIAAVGKYAKYITEDHDLRNIFGSGSPIDKLYKLDGYVLLIGVGYNKNTSLHLAESRANFTSKRFIEESSAINLNGRREWVTYKTQDVSDDDFIELGKEFDKVANIKINKVGNAEVRLMSQRQLVDWAVLWMENNRI